MVKGKMQEKIVAHHLQGRGTLQEDACGRAEKETKDPRRHQEASESAGGDEDGDVSGPLGEDVPNHGGALIYHPLGGTEHWWTADATYCVSSIATNFDRQTPFRDIDV